MKISETSMCIGTSPYNKNKRDASGKNKNLSQETNMPIHNSMLHRIENSTDCSLQELCLADTAGSKIKLFIQTIYNFRKKLR